jgi:hypothetical protein
MTAPARYLFFFFFFFAERFQLQRLALKTCDSHIGHQAISDRGQFGYLMANYLVLHRSLWCLSRWAR